MEKHKVTEKSGGNEFQRRDASRADPFPLLFSASLCGSTLRPLRPLR